MDWAGTGTDDATDTRLSQSHTKRRKPIIGLAGGIGAGKSTVAGILERLGAAVIDSDRLAHEELNAPDVVDTIRRWWGDAVVTPSGGVDRRKIGGIVFNNPAERKRLEELLYPRIQRRRDLAIAACEANANVKAVVLDTPKLFEVGLDGRCDAVIFVDADRAVRARRVAAVRQWDESELKRRENLQKPLDAKKASADHVVRNQSDLETLQTEVQRIWASVLSGFA